MNATINRFDSIESFVVVAEEYVKTQTSNFDLQNSVKNDPHWRGDDWSKTLRLSRFGDESLVAEAESVIERVNAGYESTGYQWVPGPCGAYPIVPEFIAGKPDCMRAMTRVSNDRGEVRVFLPLGALGDVSKTAIKRRGIGLIALIQRLQTALRPVELYIYHGWSDSHVLNVVRVETRPINMAQLCYVLTASSFLRRVAFVHMYATAPNAATRPWSPEEAAELLGATSEDLLLPRLLSDRDIPEDIAVWVNGHAAKYTGDAYANA